MFRIVKRRLYKGNLIDNLIPDLMDLLRYTSPKLAHRGLQRIFIFRVDHVDDRLRLGEVDPAV